MDHSSALEEEWTSSHNALRFTLIYQNFGDVIIWFGRLHWTSQHGGVASFVSVAGESSKSLTNSPLLYVHCLSKDDYPVRPLGLSCVDLICRHAHVSFIDKMAERRVALIPVANTRVRLVDKLTVRSPVLVSLITTCDMKVSYMYHTLLWDPSVSVLTGFVCMPFACSSLSKNF